MNIQTGVLGETIRVHACVSPARTPKLASCKREAGLARLLLLCRCLGKLRPSGSQHHRGEAWKLTETARSHHAPETGTVLAMQHQAPQPSSQTIQPLGCPHHHAALGQHHPMARLMKPPGSPGRSAASQQFAWPEHEQDLSGLCVQSAPSFRIR